MVRIKHGVSTLKKLVYMLSNSIDFYQVFKEKTSNFLQKRVDLIRFGANKKPLYVYKGLGLNIKVKK